MKSSMYVAPALTALLLLTACSEPRSAHILNSRVTASMTRAQPCDSSERVEYLSNGARITMPDTALFVVGRTDISQCGQYALASAIQAMLDPRIVQVVIEPGGDVNSPEAYLPRERTARLTAMLSDVGFVPSQPPVLVQPAPAPPAGIWGIVFTVPG